MPSQVGATYTRSDLLDIAEKIESTMETHYRELAKKFPEKKELFSAFADEEEEHGKLANSLLEDAGAFSDEEGRRVAEIMTTFTGNKYLPQAADIGKKIRELKSENEAVVYSAELERRVELFYCHIAPAFEEPTRRRLYELIVAEHRHRVEVEETADIVGGEGGA